MGFTVASLWQAPEINPVNGKARSIPILNPINKYGRVFVSSTASEFPLRRYWWSHVLIYNCYLHNHLAWAITNSSYRPSHGLVS